MKKNIALGAAILLCLAVLSACVSSQTAQLSDDSSVETFEIKAIALNEHNSLMFYALSDLYSGLVSVNTENAKLTARGGAEISEGDLKTGQLVTIYYDGAIGESYPARIFKCCGIQVSGEADADITATALDKWTESQTREDTVYYVDSSGVPAKKTVQVSFLDYFGEWKKANNVPDDVKLIDVIEEDNAYEETKGEAVTYNQATVKDFHLNLSEEFLTYIASSADERTTVASLVKTIIGDNPPVKDTAVFLTVNGKPLKTQKNDFSGRLTFDIAPETEFSVPRNTDNAPTERSNPPLLSSITPFTDEELSDMQEADGALYDLINSETFKSLSLEQRAKAAKALLSELTDKGFIKKTA